MKKIILPVVTALLLCSFNFAGSPFKGTWQYSGGIFNGKPDSASMQYKLQRIYDDQHYEARVIEKGAATIIYEKGDYRLKGDTCLETQTFCIQPSKLLNKTIKYTYSVGNDTLKLLSVLPNGNRIEDHWLRIK